MEFRVDKIFSIMQKTYMCCIEDGSLYYAATLKSICVHFIASSIHLACASVVKL